MSATPLSRRQTLVMAAVHGLFAMGCSAQEPPKPVPATAPLETTAEETVPSPLIGQWTLTRLDGRQPMHRGWPIVLNVQETAIHAQSQCVPFRWRYDFDGVTLNADRIMIYDTAGLPIVICARALTQWEQQFTAMMDEATTATIQDGGTMLIGTGDRQMTFEKIEETAAPQPNRFRH